MTMTMTTTAGHGAAGRYTCPRCDAELELHQLPDHIEAHTAHLSTQDRPTDDQGSRSQNYLETDRPTLTRVRCTPPRGVGRR